MTNLNWTRHEREDYKRPNEKAARIIALFLMQEAGAGIENKSEFSRRLGISRHTLDRDLTTLEEARKLAQEYIKKIQS